MLGKILSGRYKITEVLGRGAFGVTFKAIDMQRPGNPECVVKLLKPLTTNPKNLEAAKRFFNQEAEILERLGKHPQIPQLLAHFEQDKDFYLIQEYIEGHDLTKELVRGNKMSEYEVIKLLRGILEVLAFVHQEKVIHRDIKPSNIRRRNSDNKIVLIDFGAVKEISNQQLGSQAQAPFTIPIGTPGYIPSEQAKGIPKLSSDVYAVGIIAIQALTGMIPEQLPTDEHTGDLIWRYEVQVSSNLAKVLDKMVRYHFSLRYQSAGEALQAVEGLLSKSPNILPKLPNKVFLGGGIAVAVTTVSLLLFSIIPGKGNFLTYNNSNYGIKIKYPQNWQRQDIENAITSEVVAFLSPKDNHADNFQEHLSISVEDFSGTLAEYSDEFKNEIQNNFTQAKILNESTTTLANKPALKLVFTTKNQKNRLKNLQVWTLKDDRAYVITYTGTIDDYDKFVETAEKMINSFQIVGVFN